MNKMVVDTNIFIYDLDRNSVFHKRASELLNDESIELYTTSKNISEFVSVCSKLEINKELTINYLEDIIENTKILFPDTESLLIYKYLIRTLSP